MARLAGVKVALCPSHLGSLVSADGFPSMGLEKSKAAVAHVIDAGANTISPRGAIAFAAKESPRAAAMAEARRAKNR